MFSRSRALSVLVTLKEFVKEFVKQKFGNVVDELVKMRVCFEAHPPTGPHAVRRIVVQ